MRDEYAIYVPSPNMWPGRMGYSPRYIINHGTAGTAAGTLEWFQNPVSQVSAHYLVTQAGKIYQFVDEDKSAWANGGVTAGHDAIWSSDINPNLITISIEHEKPDNNNATPLTAAQALASFQLQSRICARWKIPARRADASGGITGHYSMDPVNKSQCPGAYPWNGLFEFLSQTHGEDLKMLSISDGMGQFFQDLGGGVWLCKNNHIRFIGANLAYWRKHEGAGGLPLTSELEIAPYTGTKLVVCERWIQVYDPVGTNGKRKIDNPPIPSGESVYLIHINSGLGQSIIAKPLIQALNSQINQLKTEAQALNSQIAQLKTELASSSNLQALELKIASYEKALQLVYTTVLPYKG